MSDQFGLRPFSKIINVENKMAVDIHLRERAKILKQFVSFRVVRLKHYACHFLH